MSQNAVTNNVGRDVSNEKEASHDVPHVHAVRVYLEPEGKELEINRVKTVRQLFAALKIEEETALVIRDGCLLTPDRTLASGDSIRVRKVSSRG